MRKALITMFLAATVLTPVAVQAQDSDESRREAIQQRYERQAQRNQQRYEQRQQRQEARQQRQSTEHVEPQQHSAPAAVAPRHSGDHSRQVPSTVGWGGTRDDPRLRDDARRYDRRARENALRSGTHQQREELGEEHHNASSGHGVRGEHRDYHRDVNREHRQLHRSDPTRREHREFHRDVQRDHRQVHRETHRDTHSEIEQDHRDLHRSNPTRREHRQFHREANRDHNRYHGEWDLGWRNDRRYDWQNWRYRNRDIYRVSPYYSPYRNHRYSRFSIGFVLGSPFYDRRYWISDPWQYRLPRAPYGTQWVRYYDDVLLVDVYTGQVIDVIHNFFW